MGETRLQVTKYAILLPKNSVNQFLTFEFFLLKFWRKAAKCPSELIIFDEF